MDAGYGSFNDNVASGKWEQRNNQNVDLFYFDNCSDCSLFSFSSPYWKDFFSLRHFAITDYRMDMLFSRRALAIVGVVMLALLVWFIGPLVAFDTLHPLASVGSRLVTIVLLLMFLALWLVNWSMSIIGVTVLCLVIGFVSPLLAFGDVHPFAPLWLRLTLIGLILLSYALYGLYRLWRALRLDEQLLRRFLHPRGEDVPVAGEIKADLRTVSHIVTRAIRQLKQLRVDLPGWRKVLEGKRFLYELPWFMVIGSPGDGKTTALLNTGLQFPLVEQMEQTAHILTVPGGGTRIATGGSPTRQC
uniref:IcmF-related protein n=1 Tax=Strongyloides venezuelensis TaxID=75913 RepID=A0A0K0FW85_STRVS